MCWSAFNAEMYIVEPCVAWTLDLLNVSETDLYVYSNCLLEQTAEEYCICMRRPSSLTSGLQQDGKQVVFAIAKLVFVVPAHC